MKRLIVLSGVPGSGKSYFCEQVLKCTHGHTYVVSSDELRKQVGGHQQNLDHEQEIWKIFYELPTVYASDMDATVILDSTNTFRKYRIDPNRKFKDLYDKIILVYFNIPKDILLKQNLEREFPIPNDALMRYYDTFEIPNKEDEQFFDNIYVINENNLLDIVDKIIKEV